MADENTEVRESVATTPQVTDAETSESTRAWDEEEIGALFDGGDDVKPEGEATPQQEATEQPPKPESEQSQQGEQPAEPTHKIKVRGEERDVPLSELKRLAEAGGDYTRQMQQLADQRRQVESLTALGEALRQDPRLREHLAAYQRQESVQQPPDDPIERLKWDAKQEALREFAPKLEQIRQEMSLAQQHQSIQQTMAHVRSDPMYQQVQQSILDHVAGLPESVGRAVYQQLDSDPRAYMEMYQATRSRVTQAQKPAAEAPAPIEQRRETKAPALAAPGAEQPDQSRKARFKELSRRAYGGDTAALGAMFDM